MLLLRAFNFRGYYFRVKLPFIWWLGNSDRARIYQRTCHWRRLQQKNVTRQDGDENEEDEEPEEEYVIVNEDVEDGVR